MGFHVSIWEDDGALRVWECPGRRGRESCFGGGESAVPVGHPGGDVKERFENVRLRHRGEVKAEGTEVTFSPMILAEVTETESREGGEEDSGLSSRVYLQSKVQGMKIQL